MSGSQVSQKKSRKKNRANLFHKSVGLEFVAIGETAQECAFSMFIDPYGRDVGFGSAEGAGWLQYVRLFRIGASVAIPSFVGFAVEQEVA
jgi:hypothetical protein